MPLSCGENCIKYFFFFLNLIFVAAGAALAGFGIYLMVKLIDGGESVKDLSYLKIFMGVIIIIGCAVFLIAFFGCFGAICESKFSLNLYSIFVSILIVASIAIGCLAIFKVSIIESAVDKVWAGFWDSYDNNDRFIAPFQAGWKCCGDTGYINFNGTIPSSCCPSHSDNCSANDAYKDGCKKALNFFVRKYGDLIGYGSIILGIVKIIAVSSICYLKSRIGFY